MQLFYCNLQTIRATNLVVAAMKFQKTLNAQALSPEVFYLKDTAKSPGYQRLVKYEEVDFILKCLQF